MSAEQAKLKNIIDMAFGFSAMTRVFEEGSTKTIVNKLSETLSQITSLKNYEEFKDFHDGFCRWFARKVKTAERRKRDGTKKSSGAASYGQGAKVLDVALKVYVYYCHLPDPETAERIAQWLNSAIDTKMMKYLKNSLTHTEQSFDATSIEDVRDIDTYAKLQTLVQKDIESNFPTRILHVQWDDIKWRELNNKDYKFTVLVERDEDGLYVALVPLLEGCYTQGETCKEALENIKDAIRLHVEARLALGEPVPVEIASDEVQVVV